MKFTFKTVKPTGRYRTFSNDNHYIKLNKIEVGNISDETFDIRLMIIKKDIMEDSNPNCKWRWITLYKKSKSLDEAKQFLNNRIESLLQKYNIYQGD